MRYFAIAIIFIVVPSAYAQRNSVGSWLREHVDRADQAIQDHLEHRPDIQRRINRGIDIVADNTIDFATPEADDECRRLQRAGVQFLLNPSHRESERSLREMTGHFGGGYGRSTNRPVRSLSPAGSAHRRRPDARREPSSSLGSNGLEERLASPEVEACVENAMAFVQHLHGRTVSLFQSEFGLTRKQGDAAGAVSIGIGCLISIMIAFRLLGAVLRPRRLQKT